MCAEHFGAVAFGPPFPAPRAAAVDFGAAVSDAGARGTAANAEGASAPSVTAANSARDVAREPAAPAERSASPFFPPGTAARCSATVRRRANRHALELARSPVLRLREALIERHAEPHQIEAIGSIPLRK